MPYESVESLPEDVRSRLPLGAQKIFQAAFNAASSDGFSEEGAKQVAWSSVKNSYFQTEDGEWQHEPEGGTGETNTGTMPAA
ncbi:MAG: cation transport regulator ChaB [Leptolyngbya sp. SIO4C1]|nr:cation transport regulator ChaB [Leptolyngbya sp. SIO4C1]